MPDQVTHGALPPPIPRKSRVSLRLDAEVLEWFRGQVCEHGGGHYQRLKDERGRRLMLPVLDFTNGSQAWVWTRRHALEEEHWGWLIHTDHQHLLRQVARLNDHLEEAHEWGFTALDGRRYAIQERRVRA